MSSISPTVELEGDRTDVAFQGPTYARITVLGLFVIALGSLLATVPEPFVGPIATALSLVVAGVVWIFGRWSLLLAAVFALPPLIISSALLVFTIMHPISFLQFVPILLVLGVGASVSLFAGTRAFAGYRRSDEVRAPSLTTRRWLRSALLAAALLSVASAVLAFTERTSAPAEATALAEEIALEFPEIEPARLEVPVGEAVRLVVRNNDFGLHTFTVEGLDVDYAMRPRSSRLIEFTPTAAGEYTYFCRVLGHGKMRGILSVK